MNRSGGRGPDEIRADIERTRTDIGETVEALEEKLSPRRLRRRARERVRKATIGRARRMATSVRETTGDYTSGFRSWIQDNTIPAALLGIGVGWLLIGMSGGREDYSERVGRWKEKAGDLADQGRGYARSIGSDLQQRCSRVCEGFSHTLEDNPLMLALGSLVAGLAVGLSLPATRKEIEAFGSRGSQLFEKAKTAAQKATDRLTQEKPEQMH